MNSQPQVIFEDNHLLVLNKPAGWVVQGALPSDDSVLLWAQSYVREKYAKPGAVYLGVVSRLDRPVSGVVPMARTSKSAARLNEQIRNRTVDKTYLAVTSSVPNEPVATLNHFLVRDDVARKSLAYKRPMPNSQDASLRYEVVYQSGDHSLMKIHLLTGRKHQIRAQLAAIGCPIVGDIKYGSDVDFKHEIALHCWQFSLDHPTLKNRMAWTCPPPKQWNKIGINANLLG